MNNYRKKPVVIQAIQWDGTENGAAKIAMNDGFDGHIDYNAQGFCGFYINTLEGKMKVSPFDFVIRGIKGEYYACREDIFINTYEKV